MQGGAGGGNGGDGGGGSGSGVLSFARSFLRAQKPLTTVGGLDFMRADLAARCDGEQFWVDGGSRGGCCFGRVRIDCMLLHCNRKGTAQQQADEQRWQQQQAKQGQEQEQGQVAAGDVEAALLAATQDKSASAVETTPAPGSSAEYDAWLKGAPGARQPRASRVGAGPQRDGSAGRLHGRLPPIGVVLFCGPNAGLYELTHYQSDWVTFYKSLGFDVCVYNYRGYGRSSGTPSPAANAADVDLVVAALRARYAEGARLSGGGGGKLRLIVHGESIGGLAACHVASPRSVHGSAVSLLVADRTFSSLPSVARHLLAAWTAKVLKFATRWQTDNAGAFLARRGPKVVCTDPNDEIIHDPASLKVHDSESLPRTLAVGIVLLSHTLTFWSPCAHVLHWYCFPTSRQAGVALQLELGVDCDALLEVALEELTAADKEEGGDSGGGGDDDGRPSPSSVPEPPSPITASIIAGLFRCLRRIALKAEGALEVAAGISPQHVTLVWYLVARTGE